MMARPVFMRILLLLPLLLMGGAALAQTRAPMAALAPADAPLVTDLSAHLIAITSSFTGTELLLFGSIDEPGEIVVVVRGPPGSTVVRRKDEVAGIWLNRRSLRFDGVPAYYAVSSTRPLDEIASPTLLNRLQIGAESLRFRPASDREDPQQYRAAVLRLKEQAGLYREELGVVFLGSKLFRAEISFPSTVAVGTYRAEVYLIRDDRVIAAQSTPLFVDKQGLEQEIFDYSRREPAIYGFIAVLLAVSAGWLAALLFRR
ncbi:TIGR02186 family protein [Ferrovibrio sp.]|uniref:TIGR02186 family protein n=1 Tax=Ferrovibrio sp. TaxID=1917215 RepID=UPI0025C45A2A|nr:TIGR02186 family protein [Ferrovibrio sp.]MBX3453151.1 TIGR02186 family protein [Ferrovibrio sp.]